MGFCFNIRISDATAHAVTALWDEISPFEDKPSMRAIGYPPHLTFAIYDTDEVAIESRRTAIDRAAAGKTELRLTFNRIRTFAGPPLVLWLDPAPKDTLRQMHDAIHAVIDPRLCRPHYRPGFWVPHCTLGMAIASEQSEKAAMFAENFRGVDAVFDVVDCVTFPPLRIAAETRLAAPS